jgi:hypothetical protein
MVAVAKGGCQLDEEQTALTQWIEEIGALIQAGPAGPLGRRFL